MDKAERSIAVGQSTVHAEVNQQDGAMFTLRPA